jgi:acetyl esterase
LNLKARIERAVARGILRLPAALQRRLVGAPLSLAGRTLDLQIQLLLKLRRLSGTKPWQSYPLPRVRADFDVEAAMLAPQAPALAEVRAAELAGPAGTIPARLYRPADLATPAPCLVFYHGGGFTLGSLDSHDLPCRQLAARTPCVVIAVDYRLAPEHPFPAAADDALAAFREVARRAAGFGIDPARIAVGGDSAGGNLAAVVAQDARRDAVPPCFQLLIYPTTDLTMSAESIRTFGKGFLLEKTSMDWFRGNYLRPEQDRREPRASPLFGNPAGVAPALVATAGFDPLCDEGQAYARKMREAGVAVQELHSEGLVHGYFNTSGAVRPAAGAVAAMTEALRAAFLG